MKWIKEGRTGCVGPPDYSFVFCTVLNSIQSEDILYAFEIQSVGEERGVDDG